MDVPPELVPDATRRDVGWILSQGGMAARRRDEFALAIARYERALTVYSDAEHGQRRLFTEAFLATAYNLNGDLDAAEAHFRAALALVDQGVEGPRGHRAAILHDLADICEQRGDLDGARLLLEQTLEIGAQNSDPERLAKAHQGLAGVAERRSDERRERAHTAWAVLWRTVAAVERVFPHIAERAGSDLWSVVLGVASDGRLAIINHPGFTDPNPTSSEINALRDRLVQIHADTAVVVCSALESPVSPEEGIRRPAVGDLQAAILLYVVTPHDVAMFWAPLGQCPEVRKWAVVTGPTAWTSRGPYPAVVIAAYQALASPKRRVWLPWH
jgi:tetratricopeptide (TPR) repeat protein